jgi:hypothetical protein
MAALSDAVVIGIVLTLVFSAAIYYMFTLFQQLEGKVNVLNNIIFDLKKANEASMLMFDNQMNFVPEPFMMGGSGSGSGPGSSSENMEHDVSSLDETEPKIEVVKKDYIQPTNFAVAAVEEPVIDVEEFTAPAPVMEVNYESMTYKELQAEGKRKHIKGASKMTKADLIDALKKHDSGSSGIEPEGMLINNPFEHFPAVDETTGEFIAKFDDEEITL